MEKEKKTKQENSVIEENNQEIPKITIYSFLAVKKLSKHAETRIISRATLENIAKDEKTFEEWEKFLREC